MKKTNRRSFIRLATGATLGLTLPLNSFGFQKPISDRWGKLLPLHDFGSTGKKVTMLGLGGFHVGRMDDIMAQETIEKAIEGGIRFFDNAESYVGGEAEIKYGKFLSPKYRDDVFLMTKTRAKDQKTAEQHLEESLKRLKTDRIDLWLMHAINSIDDVESRIENGVLDYMMEAKRKGLVQHIGFSGHTTIKAHARLLELTDEFEGSMMPINVLDLGYESYIQNILPKLHQRKMGVIAMKTLAGGSFFGKGFDGRQEAKDTVIGRITVEDAIRFAFSIQNDVLVTGAKTPEMLQEKIDIAHNFEKMNEDQQKILFEKVASLSGAEVEYYKGIP